MLHIRIITITGKAPTWVNEGFQEYVKRLSSACRLELIELSVEKRVNQKNVLPYIEKEGEKMLAAIKPGAMVIALDLKGKPWSTEELAKHLDAWQVDAKNVDLLIGGPDGLAAGCLERANLKWSLSPLTLPHQMVRIILAEQIYRAWSILQNHPYHK